MLNVLGGFIHRPIDRAGNYESTEGTRRFDPRQWYERQCLSIMITNTKHASNDFQHADLASSRISRFDISASGIGFDLNTSVTWTWIGRIDMSCAHAQ